MKRIKNSKEFRDLLSNMVEKQREEKRIVAREFMDGDEAEDNHEL